jgi:hypothetical protein
MRTQILQQFQTTFPTLLSKHLQITKNIIRIFIATSHFIHQYVV